MAMKPKRARSKARKSGTLSEVIFRLASEMEEPLCEATHLVHVLSLLDPKESSDLVSIAFAATKIETHLHKINECLRSLFVKCAR